MSWDLLQRFFESDVFNSSPFLSVSYLSRYADHVGIHYVLCQKLRQFPYEEIEFFLPQLCHLIISIDNESMALEEFLLGLCEESVTATLLTFWLFQTYLHDLSSNPQSGAFQTCRRVFNKVQHVVFGLPDGGARPVKIRENVLPVVVLSSFVLASVGLPLLPRWAGPLAVAQARKPSDLAAGNLVAEPRDSGGADLVRVQRAHTVTAATSTRSDRGRRGKDAGRITSAPDFSPSFPSPSATSLSDARPPRPGKKKKKKNKNTDTDTDTDTDMDAATLPARSTTLPAAPTTLSAGSTTTTTPNTTKKNTTATAESRRGPTPDLARKVSHLDLLAIEGRLSSSSLPLPDLRSPRVAMMISRPATPVSAGPRPADHARRHSHHQKPPLDPTELGLAQRTRLLRQHYFRSETQFLTALEGISNRLVVVPKPARLSALRAELALLARDLPAEIDVPVICPPTLVDGEPGRSRHHRIVRLNPAEATVLNSAEKVPYLLMVEILRDDFSFDPNSTDNQRLLGTLLSEGGAGRRIFDLSDSPRIPLGGVAAAAAPIVQEPAPIADSVFEPVAGDLANSPMLNAMVAVVGEQDGQQQPPQPQPAPSRYQNASSVTLARPSLPRSQSQSQSQSRRISSTGAAAATLSDAMMMIMAETATTKTALRTWTGSTSGSGPGSAFSPALPPGPVSGEPQDFSALATHMRAASQMLAQLEATSGKRPRHEVAAIRSKIIASMQSLEERSFDMDDGHGPTFDTIMARAAASAATAAAARPVSLDADDDHEDDGGGGDDADDENGDNDDAASRAAAATNPDPGLARMENDIKTGGIQRKGDRDDPSAAVFGEAWDAKKARIRRTSPYGWMKNWDLVSVIVKTGADLRQEAFACQLISVCHKIWLDASVDVWVRLMRILVTGESSGLIETITNGVSLHSIKRNLTLSSIEAGQNPRRRIATLKDHFLRTFGPEAGGPHRAGVDAFKRSLAAYSIISYVLQLKDRHNGNVLIDSEGHIVHIDFGFMLSNSPGSVGFEAAPFKLTHEYVEVLGGVGSAEYEGYKSLCKKAFQALRRSADNIIDLVAMVGRDSKMPCFAAGVVQTTATLRQRFQLHLSADEAEQFVEADLIGKSLGSYYTRLYDTFQYRTQGIY